MKKTLYTLLLLALEFSVVAAPSAVEPSLIPQPQQIEYTYGHFVIDQGATIGLDVNNSDQISIAKLFNDKFSPASGFALTNVKVGKGTINFMIDKSLAAHPEGYKLDATTTGVTIKAATPAGLFYGMETLLQLLPKEVKSHDLEANTTWAIPCVSISDYPTFGWRGLMLDVSRHWFGKEDVMRYIDELAEYKMNVFHWHLSDDQGWRIEIKSLPKLTEKTAFRAPRSGDWWSLKPQQAGEPTTYGGYYTQEDIKEVIAYAAKRYVHIVPEVDVPGHSLAALLAYPDLACQDANVPKEVNVGDNFYEKIDNTICPSSNFSYTFMDKVIGEIAALFPDQYIHIGGDECTKVFWKKCPRCQALMKKEGLKNEEELQSYFIHRMEKIVESKGKKMIGWDEILEGGLTPNATVMSWRGMAGGIEAAKQGHHVVMTPTDHCYIDLYQGEPSVEPNTYSMCRLSDSYNFKLIPDGVDPSLILGGQGNLWTEAVPHFRQAEYMAWPRGWALAEVFWHNPPKSDWNNFVKRVEDHFERADQAQINYARSMYNAIITPSLDTNKQLQIAITTEVNDLDIYYTFDNTFPDHYSSKYSSPLSIPINAARIRVVTYRGKKQEGKMITLEIKDLLDRAQKLAEKK